MSNPENLEGPNKSEKKPPPDKSGVVKQLGSAAIKGFNQK